MKIEPGQVAVVTGGASGIGLAMAAAFGARGLSVVLADIDAQTLARSAAELRGEGVDALDVITDVREPEQLEQLRDATLERLGRVDIVCNNAGVVASPMRPLWEFTLAEWYWVLDINLRGVIHGLAAFLPHLVAQGRGHVVNTSSLAGLATVPGIAPYTASKRAVVGLSESLHAELAQSAPGVGVTVLCPALVTTRLGESSELTRPADAPAPQEPAGDVPPPPTGAIEPAEVAAAVIDAIEAGRLHIAPGLGAREMAQRRIDLVNQSLGL